MLPRVQRNERIRDDESEHAGDAAGEALHAIAVPLGIIRGHEDGNDDDVNDVNDDVNDDRARQKEIRIFFSVDIFEATKFEERKGVRVVLLSLDTRGRKRRKRTIE